jgi:type VI secretion system secreted protein VgrG
MSAISKIEILIDGNPFNEFQNIAINEAIYGLDTFKISYRYDAIEKLDKFLILNSRDFLGLPIIIRTKIADDNADDLVFKGYITEIQGSRSGMADNDSVVISGGSLEILLDGKPSTRAFIDKTLEEVVNEVVQTYSKNLIKKKINPRDKYRYPYIVQHEESDLDFLKRLSVRYGEWFFINGSEMVFGELPSPKKEQNLKIGYDLKNFNYQLRINPVNFTLISDDPLKNNVIKYKTANNDSNLDSHGKHALQRSKSFFNSEGIDYYEHLNVNESDYQKALQAAGKLDEISDGLNLASLSGTSTNPFLTVGMFIDVKYLNQEDSSTVDYLSYLLTNVYHSYNNLLSYYNSFTAIQGQASIPENTNPHFIKTSGNQIGRIADNVDPKKLGRVRINFPWMENSQMMTPWVKVITPYTQKKSGFYFIPAVNSRILVGFEGGDVEKPYCMGALFDETNTPDSAWAGDFNNEDANIHAIRTVSGQTIELHDESGKEKIRIYDTNNKNEITLDTANGEITIKATEKLTIEAKEIEIKAQNDVKIEAGQGLNQKAMDIKTEAQQGLELKAMEIKTEAQTTFEAKATSVEIKANGSLKATGSGTAEVSSSGVMTVKGSMVMIN